MRLSRALETQPGTGGARGAPAPARVPHAWSTCCGRCSTTRRWRRWSAPAAATSPQLVQELEAYLDEQLDTLPPGEDRPPQQTLGFQRVLQRAAAHVQSAGPRRDRRPQPAGRDLPRARLARRLPALAAGHHPARRRHLPLARHLEDAVRRPSRSRARRRRRRRRGRRRRAIPLATFTVEPGRAARPPGKIDPLIGRERELERTVHVLCRRRKNNPVFVGDPASARPPSSRGWRCASTEGRCRAALQDAPDLRARHGRAARRHQVPRRVRGAPQGGPRRRSSRSPAPSSSSTRSTPSSAPAPRTAARWTPRTCSSPRSPAASCAASARPRSRTTSSTSSATARSPAASRRSSSTEPSVEETHRDPARPEGAVRGAPRRQLHRRGAARRRPSCRPST